MTTTPAEKLSYNFLTDKEDDIVIEESQINYDALIYLDKKDFSLQAKSDFTEKDDDEDISFYCKFCKKITDILDTDEQNKIKSETEQNINNEVKFQKQKKKKKNKKQNNAIHLMCEVCHKEEIIIGTKRGLHEYFHLT